MPSFTIPWTMSLLGKAIEPNYVGNKLCLLGEFDCELHISWWGAGDDEFGWELEAITVEWNFLNKQRHHFTKESDPVLWPIIERGFKASEVALSERILECIYQDLDDEKYSPEHYEDVSMGR